MTDYFETSHQRAISANASIHQTNKVIIRKKQEMLDFPYDVIDVICVSNDPRQPSFRLSIFTDTPVKTYREKGEIIFTTPEKRRGDE